MVRNLLADTYLTRHFAHFPDGPGVAIRSDEVRPVFGSLAQHEQDWAVDVIEAHGRTDIEAVAHKLGVAESVAAGLIVLLHPEA